MPRRAVAACTATASTCRRCGSTSTPTCPPAPGCRRRPRWCARWCAPSTTTSAWASSRDGLLALTRGVGERRRRRPDRRDGPAGQPARRGRARAVLRHAQPRRRERCRSPLAEHGLAAPRRRHPGAAPPRRRGVRPRRRTGCEEAARLLGVPALRDVTEADLDDRPRRASTTRRLARYVRHVVTENARVLEAVALLRGGRLSRTSARCSPPRTPRCATTSGSPSPEVDTAVEALLAGGALGARMTGGGFGGCVIGLVPESGRRRGGRRRTPCLRRRRLRRAGPLHRRPGGGRPRGLG